jgi:cholesterol transport system auxiliary component
MKGLLEVHRFSVNNAFVTRNLVYRLGEFKYEVDYYRQFLIPPGTMITEQTRSWLTGAQLFTRVLPVGTRITPNYTLEGNVIALYGDFSSPSASAAVMEIRFFLLDNAGSREKVIFAESYRAAIPVPDRTVEVFVDALNKALADILGRLEADLQKALEGKAGGGGDVQSP